MFSDFDLNSPGSNPQPLFRSLPAPEDPSQLWNVIYMI